MKKILTSLLFLIGLTSLEVSAQSVTEMLVTDSTATQFAPMLDSSYLGLNIFNMVDVNQSPEIKSAFHKQIEANYDRKISGYRIRIYFDNSQNARNESQRIAIAFASAHPTMKVYRSHVSPYFKVTVGDFRTKSDAQLFANTIISQYPSVFLVKENINYPD